ncbi:MAG: hypothetical protein ACK42K_03450 [Leptonema sp. (in: bacteria)]
MAPSFNYENLSRKYRVNIELLFRHIAYHNNIAPSLNYVYRSRANIISTSR